MERDDESSKRSDEENQKDRILSYMDVKYAVQTCILSKRWINQWMHISSINFKNDSAKTFGTFKTLMSNVLHNFKASKHCNSIAQKRTFFLELLLLLSLTMLKRLISYSLILGLEFLQLPVFSGS